MKMSVEEVAEAMKVKVLVWLMKKLFRVSILAIYI